MLVEVQKFNKEEAIYASKVIEEKFGLVNKPYFNKNGYCEIKFPRSESQKIKRVIYDNLNEDLDIIKNKIQKLS